MNATYKTCSRPTSTDLLNATSSPGLVDGVTRFNSPNGQNQNPSGLALVRADLSARQAKEKGLLTSATFGPLSSGSSTSAALQSSLVNRLRASLDVNGSPEYALTWKEWPMASGVPICALRASAHRTSDSGFTGWPTPIVNDELGSTHCYGKKVEGQERKRFLKLPGAALLAGWATPTTRDHKDGTAESCKNVPTNKLLGREVHTCAEMGKSDGYRLNPAFSLWLMGFPAGLDSCGATAMQSFRRSPRNSSKQALKQ